MSEPSTSNDFYCDRAMFPDAGPTCPIPCQACAEKHADGSYVHPQKTTSMRNYKFRGKRKDTGEWVYGYLNCFKGLFYILTEEEEPDNSTFSGYDIKQQVKHEVVAYTVGQFTGEYDDVGKEIYEDDLVCFPQIDEAAVAFDAKPSTSVVVWEQNYYKPLNISSVGKFKIQIVGNKHDNPELLRA